MVLRVHGRSADGRSLAQPAVPAGLAAGLVLVVDVADLAERRAAVDVDPAQLARGHPDGGVVALLRKQLGRGAGRADQLAAAAERQLDVVDGRADRDLHHRQRVAGSHRRVGPVHQLIADLEAERGQDVALLAVLVVDQRDPGAPVGVVFDGGDLAWDAQLVALEVDLPVDLLVAAALVADRDLALVVPAGGLGQRLDEALLGPVGRDLLEGRGRHEPPPGAGRLVLSDGHG